LGNLHNLYDLYLSNNYLSGEIPSSLIYLAKIEWFDIRYNCLTATDSELIAWLNQHDFNWEVYQNHCTIPKITISRTKLYFGSDGQSSTGTQVILIANSGADTLNWSASGNVSWLSLNPSSGTGDSVLAVSIIPTGLAVGTYAGTISITDPNAINSPQSISVQLQVYNPGTTTVPFGDFSTPLEGSSTYSSIPVTGWALDDIGVASVKIYNGDAYVGDAVFIEGARPDIEQAYPAYPNNSKAGWGYMLLTNFLPGGGNGTYTLIAKAADMEGNEVILGSKTINIDNAHAVKPFGAIDTPAQGGTASGSAFRNWGWVLTPQPNQIPTDGSTIDVWVDGVILGHPTYNIYRPDVATLFPGYANSNGAAGYFYLDTTKCADGVHTIQWTAADNAGNIDGIGSRYFTTLNYEPGSITATASSLPGLVRHNDQKPDRTRHTIQELALMPGEKGMNELIIKELDHVEIKLGENHGEIMGYLLSSDELKKLPIGSTLDAKTGTFYWSPGPGFLGRYSLVFVLTDPDGRSYKKSIVIEIVPRFNVDE